MRSLSFLGLIVYVSAVTHVFDWSLSEGIIRPDCIEKSSILINGDHNPPEIRAKIGDTIQIKVRNNLFSQEILLHFHGIYQSNPYMDGHRDVQCLINSGSEFTYEFTIMDEQRPGTYIWHIHNGMVRISNGASNGIMIIDPKEGEKEFYASEYEEELNVHIEDNYQISNIGFGAWLNHGRSVVHFAETILLNGRMEVVCDAENALGSTNSRPWSKCDCKAGPDAGLSVLNVKKGKTYRVRVFHAGHSTAVSFAIANHTMTIIEVEGHPVQKVETKNLIMQPGQRYSVLVTFDENVGNYWMSAQSDGPKMPYGQPGSPYGYGIIRYEGAPEERPGEEGLSTLGSVGTDLHPIIWTKGLELQKSLKRIETVDDPAPSLNEVTKTIDIHMHSGWGLFNQETKMWEASTGDVAKGKANTAQFYIGGNNGEHIYKANKEPSVFQTVLEGKTESEDINPAHFYVNVGDVVQIQWTDYVLDSPGPVNGICIKHDYHMHGDGFYIVHNGDNFPTSAEEYNYDYKEVTKRDIASTWMSGGKFKNEKWFGTADHGSPPSRKFACSTVIVRFKVRFPGVWPFHCHHANHAPYGMRILLITNQIPQPPVNTQLCGATSANILQETLKNQLKIIEYEEQLALPGPDCNSAEDANALPMVFIGISILLLILCMFMACQLHYDHAIIKEVKKRQKIEENGSTPQALNIRVTE